MRLNIFNMSTRSLGLDIGDTAIRAVELRGTKNTAEIVAYTEVAIPKGAISGDAVLDSAILADAIVKGLERPSQGKFTTKSVVVNLPESKCFVRVIRMQSLGDSEIENAIPFEAESYIPIPIDQVYLDWQRLSDNGESVEVLLIASPKEYVDKLLQVITKAGLTATALEVECQSLGRVLVPVETSPNMLIVDIEAVRTDLVMIERGNIQFTATIPIAGITLTDTIAHTLGVPTEQAEKIKRDIGLEASPEYPTLKDALTPVLNNFVSEIKNILSFHAQHSQEKVTQIVLTGGGAELKEIVPYLASQFTDMSDIGIVLGDSFQNIHIKSSPFGGSHALAFSTALGLAARDLQ